MENKAFTEKLIAEAQRKAPEDAFSEVAVEYLTRLGRLAVDHARGLFWVIPPSGPAQVAIFCPMFEPNAGEG